MPMRVSLCRGSDRGRRARCGRRRAGSAPQALPEAGAGIDRVESALSPRGRTACSRVSCPRLMASGEVLIEFGARGRSCARGARPRACASGACGNGRPPGCRNTCVLCFRRRNDFECVMRSTSRWKHVRISHGGSGAGRPVDCVLSRPCGPMNSASAVSRFSLGQGTGIPPVSTKNRCLRPECLAPFPAAIFLYDIAVHFLFF